LPDRGVSPFELFFNFFHFSQYPVPEDGTEHAKNRAKFDKMALLATFCD
jgi:hypothetical protein